MHQDGLGQFELQCRSLEAHVKDRLQHNLGDIAVEELLARNVNRDARMPAETIAPVPRLATRTGQQPFAECRDQPAFLGERDEGRRRDVAALRVLPAQ